MRLIDATPLECQAKEGMGNEWNHRTAPTSWAHAEERFLNRIEDAPTVDAVPVVRCKDCKHLRVWNRKDIYAFCPKTNIVFLPFDKDTRTFFCGFGERKDGGAE